ncbi:MAG: cupin domain-containing protein [Sphingomonadales bacterium]|nr:cupin domain-containing protein [Sphingomonadales bacterium]
MTRTPSTRRVVTGLDAEGRSCVLIDGPARAYGETGGFVWRTAGHPADNSAQMDCPEAPFSFDLMQSGGSLFMLHEFPVGVGEFWHATDSIEYLVMLEGAVTLELEAGEVTLAAGDCLVDRGVRHNWRNPGPQPARAAIVALPAHPVGSGSTV